jgi:alkylation response protein AidB-like acyl-CoA dehydrogenase
VPDRSFLSWPFFDDAHRKLAGDIDEWAAKEIAPLAEDEDDADKVATECVRRLGKGGWLRYVVPKAWGGMHERLDVRSLCLIRETLARYAGLADFAFAMQGLGTGPISSAGSDALKKRYLPGVSAGEKIAAFAISEADAGSDVTAMRTSARLDGESYVIDGEKTWISNAGIADHYIVFCRLSGGAERSFIALMVDKDNPGLQVTERVEVTAPHPLGTVTFTGCRVGSDAVVGDPGHGLRVALETLDTFRPTVGAAALGFARRALDEAIEWSSRRLVFGKLLSQQQLTQARIADMAVEIDAAALLVYRAAWAKDTGSARITREAAMAKLYATEAAQRVVDGAVQLFGGRGVAKGETVERLYREVRALRIYEGTSEVQKLVIASQVLPRTESRA